MHRFHWIWFALLSLLLGATSVLAFAPYGYWFLLPLTLAGFFYVLYNATSTRSSFAAGYLFGLGLFGAGVYWIYFSLHLFGGAISVLAGLGTLLFVMFLALFPALFSWIAYRLKQPPLLWFVFVVPALWVLFEWIRSWIFTGFPWLSAGYSTLHSPLAGYAPVGGVFLNSTMVVLSSGLIAWAACRRSIPSIVVAVIGIIAIGGTGVFLKKIEWTQPLDRSVSVTMVQGNIAQELKFQPNLIEDSIELYTSLSETGAELIVWPETAIPTLYSDLTAWEVAYAEHMASNGSTVISGGFTSNEDFTEFFNAIKVLDGNEEQIYLKRHLVPFGEFTPFRSLLSFLSNLITIPMSDLTRGTGPLQPIEVNGVHYGMSICYEDAFGGEMRGQFPKANALINVSNDAWFGDSTAPHQHQEIAAMRSLEFARPMLRVTNTGITSLIDYHGKIVTQGAQFEPVAINIDMTPRTGVTPYVNVGDWLAVGIAVLLLLLGIVAGRATASRLSVSTG